MGQPDPNWCVGPVVACSAIHAVSLPLILESSLPGAEMFDKQQANSIFWSPQGQFLVLAGLRRSVHEFMLLALS